MNRVFYVRDKSNSCGKALRSIGAALLFFLITISIPTPVNAQTTGCALDVMLVIDESGSMWGAPIAAAQAASITFVNQLNFPPDQIGVTSFNGNATLLTPPGLINNAATAITAIGGLAAGGSTNIAAGITTGTAGLLANPNPNASQVMILLTDGQSNQATAAAAALTAANSGIRIIVIGLGINVNAAFLQNQIASSPNDYYAAPTPAQLQQIFAALSQTLCTGQICGSKFHDMNGNSIWDQGEPTLSGWDIFATDTPANGPNPVSYLPVTTDANGEYCIEVPAGTYTVSELQQPPWVQTFPTQPSTHTVTVQAGGTINNINFGNRLPNGSISGVKFWDVNGNGIQDLIAGVGVMEPLLTGFQFALFSGDPNDPLTWQLIDGPLTVTNAASGYQFMDVAPGTYFIQELPNPGWIQTAPSLGAAQVVTISAGQNIQGIDFGNQPCESSCNGHIMGFKFRDANYNGNWDPFEANMFVGGVTIELVDSSGNVIQTTTTAANGLYFFLNVPPGTYTVREQVPAGWVQTAPTSNGGEHTVTISSGSNAVGLNFGNYRCKRRIIAVPKDQLSVEKHDTIAPIDVYQPKACVTGIKFNDENENGIQDGSEGPLAGFTFLLQSTTSSDSYIATSNAAGVFLFVVPPGSYILYEVGVATTPLGVWTLSAGSPTLYNVNAPAGMLVDGFDFGNVLCELRGRNKCQCNGRALDIELSSKQRKSIKTGEKFEYAFSVTNRSQCGTSGETSVHLSIPSGIELTERKWSTEGWTCAVEGSDAKCTRKETLGPDETSTLLAPVFVSNDIDNKVEICATVVARNDSNYENNSLCASSAVKKVQEDLQPKPKEEAPIRGADHDIDANAVDSWIYLPVVNQ